MIHICNFEHLFGTANGTRPDYNSSHVFLHSSSGEILSILDDKSILWNKSSQLICKENIQVSIYLHM